MNRYSCRVQKKSGSTRLFAGNRRHPRGSFGRQSTHICRRSLSVGNNLSHKILLFDGIIHKIEKHPFHPFLIHITELMVTVCCVEEDQQAVVLFPCQ